MQRAVVVTEQKMRNLNVRQENAAYVRGRLHIPAGQRTCTPCTPSSEMPEETNIAYVTVVLVTLLTFKFQQIVRSWYSVQVTFVCTAL